MLLAGARAGQRQPAPMECLDLLWSALCFVGLSLNNALLVLDLLVFPDIDLRLPRLLAALAGLLFLLYGFIWEAE